MRCSHIPRRSARPRTAVLAATGCLALAVAACGGAPTADTNTTDQSAPASAGSQAQSKLDAVYAQLSGLTGADRENKLAELAKKETGTFTIYYGINEAEDWVKAFTEKYGITVKSIDASSHDLLLRVTQEAKAGYKDAADVLMSNQLEMTQLARQYKLLLPLKTPTTDAVPKGLVWDDRTAFLENWFAVVWNPKLLGAGQLPKSWEDVLTKYKDKLILETTDWAWFATLVEGYFVKQRGMTEEQAVDMFKKAAAGAAGIAGHTLMTQLIGQGEYPITPDAYEQRVTQLVRDDKMPLAWEPPVEPIVSRVDEVGINNLCDRPASALLWIDFLMTDVQNDLMPKQDLIPITATGTQAGRDYDILHEDGDQLVDQQEKWTKLWDEVVKSIGKTVK